LLSEISGGDFTTGALAAGANEALIVDLNKLVAGDPDLRSMASQIVGVLAASTQGGNAETLQSGAWVANNATQYNFEIHMPPGLTEYGQAATSLTEFMRQNKASAEEIAQTQLALAQGQGFDGVLPANEFVKAWGAFTAGELSGLGLAALLGKAGSWFAKESVIVGAKATATPRTPLAGPTEYWKTFVSAEKQIQLEAGAGQRVDQVINETLSGKKNFTSSMTLTTDEALSAGQKYLGPEYREIGKPGSGVFHSADGTKEFRIDSGSISGAHAPGVPHVHFGVKDPVTGKYISNNHVPYAD
jgi:filamentous hemagglutinin